MIWFGPGRMCLWLVGIITHGLILTSATKWADYTQGPRRPIAGYSEQATLTKASRHLFKGYHRSFGWKRGLIYWVIDAFCTLRHAWTGQNCFELGSERQVGWILPQALLVSFVEYVQVLLAVAVAVAERQWLLYETSSIVSGGGLWLQRALLWAWTTPWPLGLNYIALGFGAIKRMSKIVIKCPCN